ncbi:aldehyde dehydrogenase family protein [Micromonospora mirobrigensis]|uniref:NADP-dependent aldehyde dehydrogenase n=1 Tax=Micromonospora mirobrigensis TaxID=262898 RepID=A0A1C5AKJ9_9ACTN|nr:aldehyde dehydrogenase family protein [Micromonospora mirobrigensis]SCF45768.1 NADP-dependent aldehyde dehydrogenase [Micromonospora mirobrigensis]
MHDVIAAAAAVGPEMATWSAARRRDLLYACADSLSAAGAQIVATARDETGLTETRLSAELERTVGQLRLLGDFVAAGRHQPARLSPGVAAGGADVFALSVPIGPVAVFAASNFPLAFGVAGGDTASALAAGCPVVVKAHPAQPATSRLVTGRLAAVLPQGVFGLVEGGPEVSVALVQNPVVRAVGFTGSLFGGRALMAAAAARPDPIPVYAEMGSLNPVFVFPEAATDRSWVTALAAAVTGSSGQLCTKPGLVVVPDETFARALAAEVAAAPTHRMLTPAMAQAHERWFEQASVVGGVQVVAGDGNPRPFTVQLPPEALHGPFLEEHFGPAVVVCCAPVEAYPHIVETLEGTLTATVIANSNDQPAAAALLPGLVARAGRVVWNGVPTGVAVCDAMHHGGPWPATSAPWATSVGSAAIQRFLRTVALQGLPPELVDEVVPTG